MALLTLGEGWHNHAPRLPVIGAARVHLQGGARLCVLPDPTYGFHPYSWITASGLASRLIVPSQGEL